MERHVFLKYKRWTLEELKAQDIESLDELSGEPRRDYFVVRDKINERDIIYHPTGAFEQQTDKESENKDITSLLDFELFTAVGIDYFSHNPNTFPEEITITVGVKVTKPCLYCR